jgi:hypothetical protein
MAILPPFLSREAFIQKSQNLWYIELDVFEIKIFLVILLHLEQIIELQVKF